LDERRGRIHDDLRGILGGDLLFEPLARAAYARDASLYEIDPLGVVVPRTEADVIATVRYAAENGLPIHARGAGTGLAGESLGPGLVVDFSRHFRRIGAIGPDSVVVQPGVVLDVLNARLAPLGRRIGPDPSGSAVRTVGGMIGVDAAGARSLRFGTTADHVLGLGVVFAHGEAATLGREPVPGGPDPDDPVDFKAALARKVAAILKWHAGAIARSAPRSLRNRAGYALAGASARLGRGEVDLARLVVGSEGTLALVTEATLRTVPIPAAQAAVLLPFGRAIDAAAAVIDCLAEGPSACELHDWRSLSLARDGLPGYRELIAESAESALVVAFEGDDPDEVARRARRLIARVDRRGVLADAPVEAIRRADADRLMGLRRAVAPLLMRMRGAAHPLPFIEDVAVPPEALPEFLARLQSIMRKHEVSWTLYAHAGHGQLHPRPLLDPTDPRDLAKIEPIAVDVYEAAWRCGGTISGEHGCGLSRTQFLRGQYPAEVIAAFRMIKESFDPANLLNPGKVVGDDPHLMTRDFIRRAAPVEVPEPDPQAEAPSPAPTLAGPLPLLRWAGGDGGMLAEASACNGCGECRTGEPTLRICPTFRALKTEAASPRAKAVLMQQVASGAVDPRSWGSEEFKQHADLCIHCNLCRSECPSGVDVSTLMLEAKAAYVENHGLSPNDWALSRVDLWAGLASRVPIAANAVLRNRASRWVLDRAFGLSKHRSIPRVHRTPFVRRADRLGLTKARPHAEGPRVAYFVDVYANHFDQELAESTVAMLRLAGVNVYVPRAQRGSGMPALVVGDLDHARHLAAANLRVLGDAVRDGYTIVCSEPTAALMLRREYPKLTDDLDAGLVAEHTRDVGEYLAGLAALGRLPAPEHAIRARVGYHQPCHLRALGAGTPGLDLIRTIPELDVEFIDRGCSGMAGTFGLARDNFRTSRRAGRGLLNRLRDDDIELGATECGACRMQMEQGVRKRTLHPMKLLALAHGLNPALRRHLKKPKPKHSVS